jgi:hypothetical protein
MLKEPTFTYDRPLTTIELAETGDDWSRAVRLQKLSEEGNWAAAAELRRMEAAVLRRPE